MVSVIIPVFNSEKFLKRCLDSLVYQKNIEIILVNDASTDNSLKIMKDYEIHFSNIKIINSEKNLKQGGARNLGIMAATCDYIGFVDSDDWTDSSMFLKLINRSLKTKSDMIGCNYFNVISEEKISLKKNEFSNFLIKISDKNLTNQDKERLLFSIKSLWCHIYKRSIILENKIFFLENVAYEDNHFVRLYTLYIKNYSFLNEPLYFYFKNEGSTTNQRNKIYQFDRLLVERKKIEDYKKRLLFEKYKNGIEIDFFNTFYLNTLILIFSVFDKPNTKKIKELKQELLKNFPNYKKNPYYNIIRKKDKLKIFLAENFPVLLKILYKFLQCCFIMFNYFILFLMLLVYIYN